MKKIKLKVIQNDIIEQVENVIFSGLAYMNTEDNYHIEYEELDKTKVVLKINDINGSLSRSGEADVFINFDINENKKVSVKSDVGSIFMESKTEKITLNKDNLLLEYKLVQNNNVVGDFKLKMEWDYE